MRTDKHDRVELKCEKSMKRQIERWIKNPMQYIMHKAKNIFIEPQF